MKAEVDKLDINKLTNRLTSRHGTTFDSAGSWKFDNSFDRNAISLNVDNTSSSHFDSRKNNFLILGEGPTYGINRSFGSPEKKFNINFPKEIQSFV